MIFPWPWGRRARRKKLLSTPIPDLWEMTLREHVPLYALLPEDERISQDRDWLAEIPVWEDANYAAVVVENLLAGSTIAKERNLLLNLTHVDRPADFRQLFVLPRRDAIGLALYQSGYVCERRGNQLLLRYPDGRPNGALFKRPLLSPSVY